MTKAQTAPSASAVPAADAVRMYRLMALGREFGDTIRFTSPPRLLQRALFGLLAPVARAAGRRALDPGYAGRELPVVDLEPLPAELDALVPRLAGQH